MDSSDSFGWGSGLIPYGSEGCPDGANALVLKLLCDGNWAGV